MTTFIDKIIAGLLVLLPMIVLTITAGIFIYLFAKLFVKNKAKKVTHNYNYAQRMKA